MHIVQRVFRILGMLMMCLFSAAVMGASDGSAVSRGGTATRGICGYSMEEFKALPIEKRRELLGRRREELRVRRERTCTKRPSDSSCREGGLPDSISKHRVEFDATRPDVTDARKAMMVSQPPASCVFDLGDGVSLEMVGVGIGSFVMGVASRESMMSAMIGHKVSFLDPYWIGKFEVTQSQYVKICGEMEFTPMGTNMPACNISWDEAMYFVEVLNDRFGELLPEGYSFALPTEAQWEFACRAGCTEDLNNGAKLQGWQRLIAGMRHRGERVASLDEVAWYEANSGHVLHPVGQKMPNAWGLYDMHGNVSEWCLDWDGDPHQFLTTLYYSKNVIDQQGATNGVKKVLRGGSYLSMPGSCASWSRESQTPDMNVAMFPKSTVGFRVVVSRPAQEQPDLLDMNIYGTDKTTEDVSYLNFLMSANSNSRKQYQSVAEWREETRMAIEKARRTTAALKMLGVVLNMSRPIIEFQLERGVRFVSGQKVGKPWEGFGERISEEWGMSDDVDIVAGDDGAVTVKRQHGLPTIKGKSSLKECESSTYQLYIGGTLITSGVEWSAAGTSISVSNGGSHARAMAGNPPIRSGTYRTGIKATYDGKTYTKYITIKKTGKSAVVNKYRKR